MNPIAKSYWRSMKRGIRSFLDTPVTLQADIVTLARAEVRAGTLSTEEYIRLIGAAYPAEEVSM